MCVVDGLHHAPQVIDLEPKWLIAEDKLRKQNGGRSALPREGKMETKQAQTTVEPHNSQQAGLLRVFFRASRMQFSQSAALL